MFTWTAPNVPATNRFTLWVTERVPPYYRDFQPFTVVTLPAPDRIRIAGIAREGETRVTVRWGSVPGARYQLQFKTRLEDPEWSAVADVVTAAGDSSSQTDTQATEAQRFYRIEQVF